MKIIKKEKPQIIEYYDSYQCETCLIIFDDKEQCIDCERKHVYQNYLKQHKAKYNVGDWIKLEDNPRLYLITDVSVKVTDKKDCFVYKFHNINWWYDEDLLTFVYTKEQVQQIKQTVNVLFEDYVNKLNDWGLFYQQDINIHLSIPVKDLHKLNILKDIKNED